MVVREYDAKRDCRAVEEVEKRCDVRATGKLSLHTDLLGDPVCRVRHSPTSLMLVAELVKDKYEREIIGMVRGCIKTVNCGSNVSRNGKNCPNLPLPHYTKLAYILGLRVSPSHRRMGVGLKLVQEMEGWFIENGAEYSYMATVNDNVPSLNLFTGKCGYTKFRTPSILVQPVYAHRVRVTNKATITKLSPTAAEALYRRRFSATEFFPRDIDAILSNRLCLGTFLARAGASSWGVVSVWNCKEVFTLEVRGASRVRRALAGATRAVDRAMPWLRLPSVPEVFRPFGLHFLFGLGGEGPEAVRCVRALCGMAHNMARECGCGVVATEVASEEPLRLGIPHWESLSCAQDLWCIKSLDHDHNLPDWTKSPPGMSIFVDPRDF
ncbi:probable N-acetyltransferase HLS1 [Salvia hispanica]|uniref:probable N-acetyltransferase HLS1 n=1 Tax=Salvia hispanica TaxID=49212 RepID=UPI0020090891|nr:probable N-acetyltransferase HLS1 [Salvia hispanica]